MRQTGETIVRQTRVHGHLVTPAGQVADGLVVAVGGRIRYVGPAAGFRDDDRAGVDRIAAPEGGFVLPGLVDIHCHGGGGASFTDADDAAAGDDATDGDDAAAGDRGAARATATRIAAGEHRRHGTTAVVAGVVTDAPASMIAAVSAAADAVEAGEVAAVHVEGPFLARSCRGAQDPRHLALPDTGLAADLLDAGRGHVRVMTLAPELPGAGALTDLLLRHGVTPAVGHTEADAGLVRRTLARSAQALGRPGLVSHLFNGMPAFHHRAPGPVAGALAAAAAGDAVVELVADGVHLADETVRTVLGLLGPGRVALVTDAMAAAGTADGDYRLGSQRVRVEGGVARVGGPDGPLAGGTAHLLDVVRRCRSAGMGLVAAVTAASTTPASVLGLPPAGLVRGAAADLVVTDRHLRPVRVMRGGQWVVPATMAG